MTRTLSSVAVLAAAATLLLPASGAFAQTSGKPSETVAGAFMAAAQAQDRQTVLRLLDESVSIQFPIRTTGQGHGEGQPFVIGYLDGLFYGQRAVSLDGDAGPRDGAVRFLAHDMQSHDRYAIDIEVRGEHVVRVTVNLESDAAAGQTVASLNPL